MILYISTSQKIFEYNVSSKKLEIIYQIKPGFFSFFKKDYKSLFGITYKSSNNKIYFACRDRLGSKKLNKPTTDATIYSYCLVEKKIQKYLNVLNIHDVHQIKFYKEYILMTDCGQNRVVIYNIYTKEFKYLNIGKIREDINHINAVLVENGSLLVNLNNNGFRESQIYSYKIEDIINSNNKDMFFEPEKIFNISDIYHTHDLFNLESDIIFCDSHKGKILRLSDQKNIYKIDGWARGIATIDKKLFIGSSMRSNRSTRYTSNLDAKLYRIDLFEKKVELETILPQCGQLNDIVAVNNGQQIMNDHA